ncbi:pseudaminic acid synthase [Shewanella loihica]|uniref:N-acetylneuraminate synthase n=1 Tax=Shewanella loihica (strain ATCC BAA-1088 / PV-4) TaxID=323850 RepID=A3QCK0_SHELP|nr:MULTISPECIES: pseudaminic acid synthase [Shewanella]ABO23198.1 N-acetylneuraminate synthase [Shewanella loihica PV-4]QYJ83682.1 pseudaminic acid synthase [Shewanella aegiceratis]QYK14185.1 pseudaminic acid synthase [Shewanella rhizosphaerae]
MFTPNISINGRQIGPQHKPYVIAELSGNHKGSLSKALSMIDAAAATGVDAIKIQTYSADTITLDHDSPEFLLQGGLWAGRTLYDLYQEAHTPWEWHEALFERAKQNNIALFSSPFDLSAIELLESLNCPAYKIASFEINDIGLITAAAKTGKPLIISTGLATLAEIEEAVEAVADAGGNQLALLHCISGYPTPIEDCNLRTLTDLCQRFDFPIGLSDHTLETTAAITAIALGASIIEKHFTLDRNDGSVDAAFSLEPDAFATLKQEVDKAHLALGHAGYEIKPSEAGGRDFRRSLYVSQAIKKGESFTRDNVRSVRPAHGLHTRYLPQILGQKASQDIAFGEPMRESYLSKPLVKRED